MAGNSQKLLDLQNADGGWSYRPGGGSWTEPTCYALLALAAGGLAPEAAGRGARWLSAMRRADGGWPPREAVPESTWVTALVLLLPEEMVEAEARLRASQCLM